MTSRRILSMLLLLALLGVPAAAGAQGPDPASRAAQEAGVLLGPDAPLGTPLTTAISYQGQLKKQGTPVTGLCDFQFLLWDALTGGNAVDSQLTRLAVQVQAGLFTVNDLSWYETAFKGEGRWLEISVRCPADSGSYETLTPRQALTATPYALTLRPGALVTGSTSSWPNAMITAQNLGNDPSNYAHGLSGISWHPMGAGVTGWNTSGGMGGLFGSNGGPAIATTGRPSLIKGPNPRQIGMLRWYDANQSPSQVPIATFPDQIAFDGTYLWVSAWGSDKIVKVEPSDGSRLAEFSVGTACPNPNPIAYDGAYVWFASESSPKICRMQATSGVMPTILAPPAIPDSGHWGMVYDGKYIWVTNTQAGSVTKIDAYRPDLLIETYPVGSSPTGIAFDGYNIWVANQGSNTVTRLRASDGQNLGTYAVGTAPMGIAFDGSHVWVANSGSSSVTEIRVMDGAILGTFTVPTTPYFLAFDGYYMWMTHYTAPGKLSRIRAYDGYEQSSWTLGWNYPLGIAFDGANIWVANTTDGCLTKH